MVVVHQAVAIARHELRLAWADRAGYGALVIMPIVLMAFVRPAFELQTGGAGERQAVPGMTVMFSMFLVANVGISYFREHGWGTWARLRSMPVSSGAIILGKGVAPLFILTVQIALLFTGGVVLFGLDAPGTVAGLALVGVTFSLSLVCLGVALVGLCSSVVQLNSLANVGTLALAGIGGALTPFDTLPSVVQTIAPAVPARWAMRGFGDALDASSGVRDVLPECAVLIGFAALFAAIAVTRLRFEEVKVHWT